MGSVDTSDDEVAINKAHNTLLGGQTYIKRGPKTSAKPVQRHNTYNKQMVFGFSAQQIAEKTV